MYRPNFCSECGKKIIRLHWHVWTSSSFCDYCAKRLRKERLTKPAIAGIALLCTGLVAGRAVRPVPPPLLIQRSANSPLSNSTVQGNTIPGSNVNQVVSHSGQDGVVAKEQAAEEDVYICGARTKKGTPCSRRVHGPVRCWQHKGMPPMLPVEKLIVKELAP